MRIIIVILFLIPFISGVCEEGQIDINSASATELDNIIHVGTKVAEYMIEARPFHSFDDLTQVKWLGVRTTFIEDIKAEGLACIKDEKEKEEEETNNKDDDEETSKEKDENSEDENEEENEENDYYEKLLFEEDEEDGKETIEEKKQIIIENEVIDLSPQNIKSENYTENLSKEDYAKYGLGLFCVFLFGLFGIKNFKIRKNEFR
ncbi:MAG: helix-hairpin-helix domain-containing protein [Candidatus Pacearchaeota archaeon]|nr:helix-hairpin-helix domain-containing protein [Candidatus Pacearchaeota archaeon]